MAEGPSEINLIQINVMKKLYLILNLILLSCFIFVSCLDENSLHVNKVDNDCVLTVEDAKAFFENKKLDVCHTKSDCDPMPKYLMPGDFTPLWSNAQVSNDGKSSNVNVPIIGEYKYKAYRSYHLNNKIKAYSVDVAHKLVITKNVKTNRINSYLTTFIPDENCKGKKYSENFIRKGSKNNFSGWVIYTLWEIQMPFLAEYYNDGVKTISVTIPKVNGKKSINSVAFGNLVSRMRFSVAQSSIKTRSGEDDYDSFADWFMDEIWPDAEDGDHYEMKGNDDDGWYLEDQNGNKYDIPDGVGDDPFTDSDDDSDETNWSNGDDDPSWGLTVVIRCPQCNTVLAEYLVEEWENVSFYYCPKCKKYFKGNVY